MLLLLLLIFRHSHTCSYIQQPSRRWHSTEASSFLDYLQAQHQKISTAVLSGAHQVRPFQLEDRIFQILQLHTWTSPRWIPHKCLKSSIPSNELLLPYLRLLYPHLCECLSSPSSGNLGASPTPCSFAHPRQPSILSSLSWTPPSMLITWHQASSLHLDQPNIALSETFSNLPSTQSQVTAQSHVLLRGCAFLGIQQSKQQLTCGVLWCLMVRVLAVHCRGQGSVPAWRAEIPQALWHGQKVVFRNLLPWRSRG